MFGCGRHSGSCNRLRDAPQPLADAGIRVYDELGNVIDTHEHKGEFKEW
jgi:hypothetical protein